jgi:hypothetical protein
MDTTPPPRQLVLSLLIVLGALTVARDLLRIADRLRMAHEASNPERLHEEIQEHLRDEEA